jgi:pimeloyl-ACP methyl ester carboxylesterase
MKNIVLKDMGSFAYGGIVDIQKSGETFHGDHGYAQYFLPVDSYNWPIVMWHGMGQSGACWESTPDGRDGFWQIFTRRNWPVYIVDQPRRGRAGHTNAPLGELAMKSDIVQFESAVWATFRIGEWRKPNKPRAYEGTAFPVDNPYAVAQFMRKTTPDTGDEPFDEYYQRIMAANMCELLERIGPSILFAHSHSGPYVVYTAMMRPDLVKAVFVYEPSPAVFPDDFEVEYITSPCQKMVDALLNPYQVPREMWLNLAKIPIVIFEGDFIKETPSNVFGEEVWRINSMRQQMMVDLINANGGNAKFVKLTDLGITGNGHGGFAEMNNVDIANEYEKEMNRIGLNAKDVPHAGPKPVQLEKSTISFDGYMKFGK